MALTEKYLGLEAAACLCFL